LPRIAPSTASFWMKRHLPVPYLSRRGRNNVSSMR
jgi:hypothetical protein